MLQPLRIAQVAPPLERVPPKAYGGTERVVFELVQELLRRGHDVTTFASGDSDVPGHHVVTVPRALRPIGFTGDVQPAFVLTQLEVMRRADDFDLIHSHVEWASILLARAVAIPVVATFHGRLDNPLSRALMGHALPTLVAISQHQAGTHPDAPWAGVVHNGLTLRDAPFDRRRGDALCFVGRVDPEKGIVDAMEIAARTGRHLRIAAKIGTQPTERAYYEDVFRPAVQRLGAEFLGEISSEERDQLLAESFATLMPGNWPEPFGLVAIESLACGTPLLARRVGALPEILREGRDGFFADDVEQAAFLLDRLGDLDRHEIRRSALLRFSASRMADEYEAIYERVLAGRSARDAEDRALADDTAALAPPVSGRRPPLTAMSSRGGTSFLVRSRPPARRAGLRSPAMREVAPREVVRDASTPDGRAADVADGPCPDGATRERRRAPATPEPSRPRGAGSTDGERPAGM